MEYELSSSASLLLNSIAKILAMGKLSSRDHSARDASYSLLSEYSSTYEITNHNNALSNPALQKEI